MRFAFDNSSLISAFVSWLISSRIFACNASDFSGSTIADTANSPGSWGVFMHQEPMWWHRPDRSRMLRYNLLDRPVPRIVASKSRAAESRCSSSGICHAMVSLDVGMEKFSVRWRCPIWRGSAVTKAGRVQVLMMFTVSSFKCSRIFPVSKSPEIHMKVFSVV